MNTYQPVKLESGAWAIERFVDGESHCFMLGRYEDENAACRMVYLFARVERLELPIPPDTE